MAQSRFSAELPLEAVVARICKGIHSSPDLFKSDIRLSLASNATVRTPEESSTGNPSEAKMATIEFSVAADLRTPGKFNERDFIWVHRSDNGIGAEVSISSLPCNERDSADVMTAIRTFVEKRSETEFDADIVAAIQNDSATAENNETEASSKTNRTTTNSPKLKIVRIIFWISLALSIITFIAFFPLIGYDIDLGYGTLALLVFFFAVLIIDYSYLYFGLEEPIIGDRGFAESLGKAGGYAVLGIIVLAVLIVLGTCAMGGGGSSKSHSTEETAEFLTNIDTPGTSEYKWYHDEYLPDNDLPDR